MLTVPIFYPVVSALGFDPIWFGVNVYVVSGIARDVPLYRIFKGAVPLLIALILFTFLMIPFPQIALVLPNLMR